jgi:hypothetical protein
VEPEEGIQIWERVESGLAQVNGWGYCRVVWNDEPPWIALGNLLRYRVRARLVSGYARIFNPEFTIKVEMIVQVTPLRIRDVDLPASADLKGVLRYREDKDGAKSQTQQCVKNSDGEYVWTDIFFFE